MIALDAHVHLYPGFDRDVLLDALVRRAARLAPGATPAFVLADREGQDHFAAWSTPGAPVAPGCRWHVLRPADPTCVLLGDGPHVVFAFAGRQVAAAERVEAIGLFSRSAPPDGLPLAETLRALAETGALPALAWGIGKWLFARERLVRRMIDASAPANLLLADSALRPVFWPEPVPMRIARRRGFRILRGTDPLPRTGDEREAGRYLTRIDGELDPAAPSTSLRRLLLDPVVALAPLGRRQGPAGFLRRLR